MKQRDLAKLCGVGESTVSGWKKAGEMPHYATALLRQQDEITSLNARIAELETCIKVLRQL